MACAAVLSVLASAAPPRGLYGADRLGGRQVGRPFLAVSAARLQATQSGEPPRRPNIVMILADDLGYGDVGALNESSKIPTPNLDRLAAEGMTFTDAHSPSSVCTPTRYGLLTGRYCWRGRLKSGVLDGYGRPLIEPGRMTVATMLTRQHYTCGVVGKWHLGLDFAYAETPEPGAAQGKTKNRAAKKQIVLDSPVRGGPNRLGFAFSHIIPASLDFPPYVFIRDGRVTDPATVKQPAQKFPPFLRSGPRSRRLVMENCLDDLLAEATGFIRREAADRQKPFFLYFPLTAPHKPVLPHRRFRGKTKLGPYGDFIVQVDWTVGQVLESLDDAGARDNTLVVFTSDNGSFMFRRDGREATDHVDDETVQAYRADRHRSNFIYRGTKADIWEGGHRVPLLVRWPGKVRARSRCEQTVCLTDAMATWAGVSGAKLPRDAAEDSFSLLPLLLEKSKSIDRAPVIHHSASGMFAIRDGRWKLVAGNGSGGRESPAGKPLARPFQLFDIRSDAGERNNLIDTHPKVAERLTALLEKIRTQGRSR